MAPNKNEQIRRRAYEIWESEGRPEGANLRHWQQACDELGGDSNYETPQELLNEIDRNDDHATRSLSRRMRAKQTRLVGHLRALPAGRTSKGRRLSVADLLWML
ncbi:DUF2934 domain-containing protein [Rhizobium mongolense]|uniref:DUF2934 domain-containing protein n=1 Tax=Rhizobium mongolense TaxID=57676 RepID=UPI0035577DFB